MIERHNLLVVDDEPGVVESLFDLFRLDYNVHTALSAKEAFDIMCCKEIHIVMTDQRMPFMSGVELLAQIKGKYPDAIRILFTGYADIEAVIEAINQGNVFRYVVKPWNTQELRSIIKQAGTQYDLLIERRELLEKLRVANELKSNFIAIASHELNTPTFIISGMTKLAEKMVYMRPSQAEHCLEAIKSASARLETIVTNMLRLVAGEEFTLETTLEDIALHELLDELNREIGPFFESRNIHLEVEADPEMKMHVNRDMVEDIILNLVSNAVRFSPDGSTVVLQAEADERQVTIRVIDHGTGIAPADMPHVFEPFFTSKDILHHFSGEHEFGSRGIGLGLTVAKKFTEMHGGNIEIDSTPGEGTTVTVTLPTEQARREKEEVAEGAEKHGAAV